MANRDADVQESKADTESKMIFYKAVFSHDGILTSAAADGEAEVIYKPGEWAEAPKDFVKRGHHLLVFDDLDRAIFYGNEVWSADVEEEITNIPPRMDLENLKWGIFMELDADWPEGTHMFKRVMLKEKVYELL